MRPQGSQKLCKTIETCRSVLKSLLCSCRRHLTSIELEIVKKPLKLSSRPSKLPPVRRKRLLADLQDALRRVEQLDVPSKPPQRQRASSGRARPVRLVAATRTMPSSLRANIARTSVLRTQVSAKRWRNGNRAPRRRRCDALSRRRRSSAQGHPWHRARFLVRARSELRVHVPLRSRDARPC